MTSWEVGNARRVLVADVIVPQDYVRLSLDNDALELYRHVIKNPSQHLPPIIVGTDRTLHDGRHRLEAYRLEEVSMIEAVVELALEPKYRCLLGNEVLVATLEPFINSFSCFTGEEHYSILVAFSVRCSDLYFPRA